MKKQDLVKLAILGLMGVGTSVGALQQQQTTQPSSVQGTQPATTSMPHSCGMGAPTSGYSSSDTSNKTNGPMTYQVPTGKPAAPQSSGGSCQGYTQPQNSGQSTPSSTGGSCQGYSQPQQNSGQQSSGNYRGGSCQGYTQPQNSGTRCNSNNGNR